MQKEHNTAVLTQNGQILQAHSDQIRIDEDIEMEEELENVEEPEREERMTIGKKLWMVVRMNLRERERRSPRIVKRSQRSMKCIKPLCFWEV